jgi:hypothetical protein
MGRVGAADEDQIAAAIVARLLGRGEAGGAELVTAEQLTASKSARQLDA